MKTIEQQLLDMSEANGGTAPIHIRIETWIDFALKRRRWLLKLDVVDIEARGDTLAEVIGNARDRLRAKLLGYIADNSEQAAALEERLRRHEAHLARLAAEDG